MKNTKEITIEIKGKKWEEALDKAYTKKLKEAKVDGFRKGKVPKDMYIKKYGKMDIYIEAGDLVLSEAYTKMLDKAKDILEDVVAQPDMELADVNDDKIKFKFTLTLKPEVKLGKYKGLGVKKEVAKATKEEIKETIEQTRQRFAEDVLKEGPIENGNIAIIDFEGFVDGKAFDGGKSENYELEIGSGSFIPGFEEQLIGLKEGDEKEINVKFPEDYHSEDVKGKDAVFKIKVHEVKEVHIPELDKDFFEDLGIEGVDTKEALEAYISENIISRKDAEFENKYIDELLNKAAENTKVEIPGVMIEEETSRMVSQYSEYMKSQGLDLQTLFKITGGAEEKLREEMRPGAEKRVKERLMLEEIAKQEKIEVSDKEAEERAKELAENYGMEKDEFLKTFGGLDMVKYDLKMRKAIDVLKED